MAVLVMHVLSTLGGRRDGRWARVAAVWPTLAILPLNWRDADTSGAAARDATARAILELRAEARAVFERCVAPALARIGVGGAADFRTPGFALRETWAWTFSLVTSPSHEDGAHTGGPAVLPLTDLFDGVPRGHPSANVELVDGRPRAMWARATRAVTPGEPLLLDCGPASSAAFAAQYGAVPPGFPCAGGRTNPREVVALRPPCGGADGWPLAAVCARDRVAAR